MKNAILILIILLYLPLVVAVYGGETWKYHFDKCDMLEVNITAIDAIDENEYTILNNCTKEEKDYYICDCEDNYDFNVSFEINAVNNYTFNFNYVYSEYVKDSNGGNGGSGYRSSGVFTIRFIENKSRILMLKPNIISRFWVNGNQHTIKIIKINNNSIVLEIRSELQTINLILNQSKIIIIDNERLELTLTEIRGKTVFIKFEKLGKEVKKEVEPPDVYEEEKVSEEIKEEEEKEISEREEEKKDKKQYVKNIIIIFIVLVIILWLGVLFHFYKKYRKVKKEEGDKLQDEKDK